MDETELKSAVDPKLVPARNAVEIVAASATEAFGSAFLVWILGGVAISIASGFAGEMVPSLPPGFDEAESSGHHHHASWHAVRGVALGLFFAIFFIHSLWVGFRGKGAAKETRMERILSHLRENWFSLIVGNAIGAWVAILIVSAIPNFALLHLLWHWILGIAVPAFRAIAVAILGASSAGSLSDWFSWYNDNQKKLNFWILYLAGAFDDMGVPNVKTLARYGWRRFQKRKNFTLPTPADRTAAGQ